MLLIEATLEYAEDTRYLLRYKSQDDALEVVGISPGKVAREYYNRFTARGDTETLVTTASAAEFDELMELFYVAATARTRFQNEVIAGTHEMVFTRLDVRIDSPSRRHTELSGCEIYLYRHDWVGDRWVWKDRVAAAKVLWL